MQKRDQRLSFSRDEVSLFWFVALLHICHIDSDSIYSCGLVAEDAASAHVHEI